MYKTIAIIAATLAFSSPAQAAPDALKLMLESDARHRLAKESTEWNMVLQKAGGAKRVRKVEVLRIQDPKDVAGDRQRIRFIAPGDIKDTRLLSIEKKGAQASDDQWLYLPAFRKTRRIGTGELGDRFAGTDLYFEDLRRRRVREYHYKLLGSETINGHETWKIESKPASARVTRESPYARSVIWLRKDSLFVAKMRHFDRKDRPLKELRFEKLKAVRGKVWRPDRIIAIDVQRRHRTVIAVVARAVTPSFSKDLLSPNSFGDR